MQVSSYKRNIIFSLLSTALLLTQTVTAESFRVHKTIILPVSEDSAENTIATGVNDAVVLALPDDMTFVQGVELSIKVPQLVTEWQNSVGWSFYNDITPSPTEKTIDYSGTRIGDDTKVFGSSFSLNIQIPLLEKNTIKQTPYAVMLKTIPSVTGNKVFFRLQLGMKGVPDEFGDISFTITAKPILIDKGRFVLSITPPAGTTQQPYSAFIDGKSYTPDSKGIMLDTGTHTVSLVSDYYRNEVRTVTIEQAKDAKLHVTFRDIAPTVLIIAPAGTAIYFDDNKIENTKEPFSVPQGDHTVRFSVGDYEVVKSITAVNDRSYTVSVMLDASVIEEK